MINWIRSTQGLYTLNYALAKSRLHYTLDPVSLSLEIELHRICSTGYLPLESDRPISFVHNFERLSTGIVLSRRKIRAARGSVNPRATSFSNPTILHKRACRVAGEITGKKESGVERSVFPQIFRFSPVEKLTSRGTLSSPLRLPSIPRSPRDPDTN